MRRIALLMLIPLAGATAFAASAGADDTHSYEIEMYNAFGIVEGSDVRVSGVNAGRVTSLEINEDKRAVVTVEVNGELAEFGEDTRCSTEPQSLIAEYFIDCDPAGPPMPDGGTVPASRVTQTVQTDIVQNTLREPYVERLQLLINEFGTGLAGNADNLNEAIRLGAPALTETRKVTRILADQNRIISDLTANSDRVIGELAQSRGDVVSFIDEAEDAASASAARREDLSRDFELLDDFLAELNPTLAQLEDLALTQGPLLSDLRAAAPGLNQLALDLPAFNAATEESLATLGDAAVVGRTALTRGRDEIESLADAGRKAPVTAEALADFVRDIDDPRRAVEIDDRAVADTGRTDPRPGQKDTKGYTGFESLLNYLYYLTGTTAQFDQVAHTMHINIQSFEEGPCGHVNSGRDPETGERGVPTNDGELTTDLTEAADCVQWLGPNQPGITEAIPERPYPSAVCPRGTEPEAAQYLCDPNRSDREQARQRGDGGGDAGGEGGEAGGGTGPEGSTVPAPGGDGTGAGGGGVPGDDVLDDILDDLPQDALDDLPGGLGNALQQGQNGGGTGEPGGGAAGDLLDFLLSSE
jgi:virulence factor Mce-like protein